MLKPIILIITSIAILTAVVFTIVNIFQSYFSQQNRIIITSQTNNPTPTPTPVPKVKLVLPGTSYFLTDIPFIYQTFNNCGPASLSMILKFYNLNVSQEELGNILRPYQHPLGYNDDKSVTFPEFIPIVENYNLVSFHRPNGDIDKVKLLLTNDIPILTRTWVKEDYPVGHFRIITGYDDQTGNFTQVDSIGGYQRIPYQRFLNLWQPFNYEYMTITSPEKEAVVKKIIGEEVDESVAWQNALKKAQLEESLHPDSVFPLFNQSVAHYHLRQYTESVEVFEKVEKRLTSNTLWYQIEPILAYQQLKNHTRVLSLTDRVFQGGNIAFSELYIIRGEVYLDQGNREAAQREFEKAYQYNRNLPQAKEKLNSIRSI
ncbi:MAG: hypothetical protein C4584_00600 [Armatimonadetes bacterium]|nr:MAG: hypothetical protein C4584_00600 [Armatimonadota bacterium]